MAHLGHQEYFFRMPAQEFSEDFPVDTFSTHMLRENLAHLISSYPQYRVNWVSGNDGPDLIAGATPICMPFVFPITIPAAGRVVNLDIRVAAYNLLGGETTTVRARVVRASEPLTISVDSAPHDTIWESAQVTTTLTAGAASWVIDDQEILAASGSLYAAAMQQFSSKDSDGTERTVHHAMMRLEVCVKSSAAEGAGGMIAGVQVREFI